MRPLRLAVMLEQALEVGGGFQQPLNDLLWLRDWAAKSGNEIVAYSPYPKTLEILKEFGIDGRLRKFGVSDHLFLFLKYCGPFDLVQIALELKSPFERALIRDGIDVVHFTSTSKRHLLLYALPYIITIFDGCHRDAPEFPEVRTFGEFERREILFRLASTKAAAVIVNAPELIDDLCRRYAMERERAICIPFSPSTYVSSSALDTAADTAVMAKYRLEPGYLFYPAQFWPHKNHMTLLAALADLRERSVAERLVLCGSDRGGRDKIDAAIRTYGLSDQISIIGFVESAELGALYRGAAALVMPSYFGPTNLPPLEAWAVGTPVIYPEAFKAQAGDAAILFDYDDPHSLADAIISLRADGTRERLGEAGHRRLAQFAEETKAGHQQFARHLERLRHRLALTPR
ncbi:glycosyltransferase family 4 protein [Bradyrhizobium diazoefficiens]|uniref:glycosyltransferase family 4 protein n=1 Tax=Bradyrhizobium diazoefficiens TaxID=1355477 RepID=UPI00190A59CB|nr:glycosyltransferase family 1 protein [Bradyrhizobium diazoefficiens]MBK3665681.1 glycosyltransferase family 4 protein [Bradyrhizobium diazoefficiens]